METPEQIAERLLPCRTPLNCGDMATHSRYCAASHRTAVAEAIRARTLATQYRLPDLQPCGGYYCDESVGHIDCEPPLVVCANCSAVIEPTTQYIEAGYKNLLGVRPGLTLVHPFCNEQCVIAKYVAEGQPGLPE